MGILTGTRDRRREINPNRASETQGAAPGSNQARALDSMYNDINPNQRDENVWERFTNWLSESMPNRRPRRDPVRKFVFRDPETGEWETGELVTFNHLSKSVTLNRPGNSAVVLQDDEYDNFVQLANDLYRMESENPELFERYSSGSTRIMSDPDIIQRLEGMRQSSDQQQPQGQPQEQPQSTDTEETPVESSTAAPNEDPYGPMTPQPRQPRPRESLAETPEDARAAIEPALWGQFSHSTEELQRHLNRNGFEVEVDGYLGPQTMGAVTELQSSRGEQVVDPQARELNPEQIRRLIGAR